MEQTAAQDPQSAPLTGWRAILRDLAAMVRFYSRLPVPKLSFEQDVHSLPDFRTTPRMVAIAGLVIGLPGALMLWMSGAVGLTPLMAAGLAVAVSVAVTGALHEDGLADTFDGLAGGSTPERRLEIMKDSRIGAFGGSALVLGIGLRIAALAGLIDEAGAWPAAILMLAAASLSRSLGLMPLALLPPARPDGFSSMVGRPGRVTWATTLALSLILTGFAGHSAGVSLLDIAGAAALAVVPTLLVTGWSHHAIRGQTGDIAGAAQQLAEIAFYAGVLIVIANA